MRDYQQEVRDLIFSRETEGKAIWEIGLLIEKIIREQVEQEVGEKLK